MGLQALLVQLDDELFFLKVVDDHVDDAIEPQQPRLNNLLDYVEQAVAIAAPSQVGIYDGALVGLPAAQADAIDVRGQEGAGLVEFFAHLHVGQVHVGAGLEVNAHLALIAPRTRTNAVDVVERAQRLLQWQDHQALDLFGGGVVVLDAGRDPGRGNARQLLYGQAV